MKCIAHLLRTRCALVQLAVLAACSSQTCGDPSRAGFFGGIGNLASNCYADQEAALRQQLADAEARRQKLGDEATALEARAATLKGEVAAQQKQLARQQRDLATASARLDQARRLAAGQERELARLRERERSLALTLVSTGEQPPRQVSASDIAQLEAQNEALTRQIDDFLTRLDPGT